MSKEEPLLPLYTTDTNRSSSVFTMQELDPSPVDESPPEMPTNPSDLDDVEKTTGGYFPPPSRSTTNSLGLNNGNNNRIPKILLAIQKYSTIPPTIYLIMHYTNTALIPVTTWSLQKSEKAILLSRPYYQSFPIEPLMIFAPVAAHIISGLTLRLYRRQQTAVRYGAETHAERHRIRKTLWPKLSLSSALGYLMAPMVAGHVLVNRITPQKVHGDSSSVGLRFFSYGVSRHPWLANIGYAIMVSVASFHFVGGAAKYLKLTREYVTESGEDGRVQRKRRSLVVNALSAIVAGIWMVGGLGVIGRGVDGAPPSAWELKAWNEVYNQVPVVGSLM